MYNHLIGYISFYYHEEAPPEEKIRRLILTDADFNDGRFTDDDGTYNHHWFK